MILTYPRENYDEEKISQDKVVKLIKQHSDYVSQLQKKKDYYLGKHIVADRRKGPNNQTVSNHAKDITDTATGYFMGNAINYSNTGESDIEPLLIAFDNAEIDENDHDNALDMSIYGVAYEYIYAKENTTELNIKNLEPEHTFLVYDDSIEQFPLFAVYYYQRTDDSDNKKKTNRIVIFTENLIYNWDSNSQDVVTEASTPIEHHMGEIPIVEYQNNKYRIGDFEQQMSLIDAYNTLTSARVNDKEQFIDSILLLYGTQLADNAEQVKEAAEALREHKLLELPDKARAEYLTKTLDENGTEVLRKAIKEDIYTFSHVPNLSDENFAGNSSGVAMEFKLLGLEMITKTKERYYKKGLRKRIRIFCKYLGLQHIALEANSIVPQFNRGLPKNLLELSQIVANLSDKVTAKSLLSLLPFVEDPDAELDQLNEQKNEAIKRQQELFTQQANQKLEVADDEQE